MIRKWCDCCNDKMAHEAFFETLYISCGPEQCIKWEICETCATVMKDTFQRMFAWTHGRPRQVEEPETDLMKQLRESIKLANESKGGCTAPVVAIR